MDKNNKLKPPSFYYGVFWTSLALTVLPVIGLFIELFGYLFGIHPIAYLFVAFSSGSIFVTNEIAKREWLHHIKALNAEHEAQIEQKTEDAEAVMVEHKRTMKKLLIILGIAILAATIAIFVLVTVCKRYYPGMFDPKGINATYTQALSVAPDTVPRAVTINGTTIIDEGYKMRETVTK